MIKVVLFDVDNTLIDFDKCAHESMLASAKEAGLKLPDNIFEVFTKINTGLWHDIEKGKLTRNELLKIRWNTIFGAIGVDYDGEAFEELFKKYLWESAVHVEGAKELLDYLNGRYIMCVASNAVYEQQRNRLTNAGFFHYMKYLFISEDIGFPKPSKEFFTACHEKLSDYKKDEIIMIGDSLSADINGAHDYGFVTCWFNFRKEAVPEDLCADYTVNSLKEIQNIL